MIKFGVILISSLVGDSDIPTLSLILFLFLIFPIQPACLRNNVGITFTVSTQVSIPSWYIELGHISDSTLSCNPSIFSPNFQMVQAFSMKAEKTSRIGKDKGNCVETIIS